MPALTSWYDTFKCDALGFICIKGKVPGKQVSVIIKGTQIEKILKAREEAFIKAFQTLGIYTRVLKKCFLEIALTKSNFK